MEFDRLAAMVRCGDAALMSSVSAAGTPSVSEAEGVPPAAVGEVPPCGITGGKVTRGIPEGCKYALCVDWLNLVLPGRAEVRARVVEMLDQVLGVGADLEHGFNTYQQSRRYESGALIAWTEGRPEFLVSLNGDSCEFFSLAELLQLLKWMEEVRGHVSRIDVAFDDFTRELLVLDRVHVAADAGNFCGFKVHRPEIESTRRGVRTSDGHTFGRKGKEGSGRQVVFYDKALESRGQVKSIRLEARFFKELASLHGQALASSFTVDSFESKLRAMVGGAIDFRDRQQRHKHISRMERLAWWQAVVDVLGSARLVAHRSPPDLRRALSHCSRQWSGSFALLHAVAEAQGLDADRVMIDWVRAMVRRGEDRKGIERGRFEPGPVLSALDVGDVIAEVRDGI